jgi:transcriptional regulator GlxA family with amidase domain
MVEGVLILVGDVLAGCLSPAPTVSVHRRHLADEVRTLLSEDPGLPLAHLTSSLRLSPYGLSRAFQAATGVSISRCRRRLRVRRALDLIREGVWDLAAVAADAGFSDQAHLTRSMREEYGHTPGCLRAYLHGEQGARL